jgi:Flp pilus assembly protein TadG
MRLHLSGSGLPPAASRLKRCGSSAVELALLLPLLGLLFLFTIDFARLYYHYSIVTNCARNGALYASDPRAPVESPYPNVTAAALADASDLTPQPTVSPPTYSSDGSTVQVTVTYPFTTISNYPGLPNPINLTRTVQMRVAPLAPN